MQHRVGVLSIQGAISEHRHILKKTFAEMGIRGEVNSVKKAEDLESIDALIIPGGESTTIGRLADRSGVSEKIKERVKRGMPVLGTCAGMIVMAKEILDLKAGKMSQENLSIMDISVIRNAFGRQRESFEVSLEIPKIDKKPFNAVFIRAPIVNKLLSKDVEVLAKYGKKIVAVQQRNMIALSFHPELTEDTRIFRYFIELI